VTCTFNCLGNLALEFQRSAGKAAWEQFPLFVHELQEEIRILVIDVFNTALFEAAVFFFFASAVGGFRYLISFDELVLLPDIVLLF